MKLTLKNSLSLRNLSCQFSLPRGVIYFLIILGAVLLVGVICSAAWFFYRYEGDRLQEPPKPKYVVPILQRDELEYFAGRMRSARLVAPSPSPEEAIPSPSPR